MSYSKRLSYPVVALSSATIALLLYAVNWTKSAELGDIPPVLTVIGNFHPILLHLPIGLFVYLGFAEAWNFLDRLTWKRGQIRGGLALLALGTVGAVVSAFAGLLLYLQGDYSGELIDQHMNWGTGFAISSLVLLCCALIFGEHSQIYRLVLLVTLAALTVGAHKGGLITHGDPLQPLFKEPTIAESVKPAEELLSYEIVDKIFRAKCYDCHSVGKKKKGGLLMDSYEALLAGGRKGKALVPGDLEASKISTYPHLPLEDDLHMPPEGKPQLTNQELDFIDHWILAGAPTDELLVEQELSDEQFNWAVAYMERELVPAESPVRQIETAKETKIDFEPLISAIEVHALNSITRVGPEGRHLLFSAVNARDSLEDEVAETLADAGPFLVDIDLASTELSGSAIRKIINSAPNLKRLNLSGTELDARTIETLVGLESLESLVLFDARFGPQAPPVLSRLKQLEMLYLAGTGLDPTQIQEIRQSLINAEVVADDFLTKHQPRPGKAEKNEDGK